MRGKNMRLHFGQSLDSFLVSLKSFAPHDVQKQREVCQFKRERARDARLASASVFSEKYFRMRINMYSRFWMSVCKLLVGCAIASNENSAMCDEVALSKKMFCSAPIFFNFCQTIFVGKMWVREWTSMCFSVRMKKFSRWFLFTKL